MKNSSRIKNGWNLFRILIFIFVSNIYSANLSAQPNTLYFMDRVHQSDYLNPATQGYCKGYLSLPAISGIYANISNSGFDYNDLIHLGTGLLKDSLVIDIENVKGNLGKNNYVLAQATVPILGFGFWSGNSYFTFEISNKTRANIAYPKSLVAITAGNAEFIGMDNPAIIDHFGPSFINYHEIAFGWSKKITHRLTIGAKLKWLSGLACVQNKSSDIKLYTADSTYAMQLHSDTRLNVSAPVEFVYDESGMISDIEEYNTDNIIKDVSPGKNFGLGLDFGAIYQFNDEIKFYASITDLGFIRWNKNATNLWQKGVFEFSGLTLDSVWSDSDYDEFEELADSISDFFRFEHTESKFTTALNTNLFFGATYDIAPFLNFGILSKTSLYAGKMHQAFTLSANFKPTKGISASLSYSMMNREYKNIGLGLAFKLGPMQLYLITDNVYAALMPKNSKTISIMTGLNMNFGCGKRDNYSMINNNNPDSEEDFM